MERVPDSSTGLVWIKSSYSGTSGGDCVEVASTRQAVHVRDSKNQSGAMLHFTGRSWGVFTVHVCATGERPRSK
jgi:Domain of unknown function (DUF397)